MHTSCWIHHDITAREQTQREIRESEERYRSLITALSEGIVFQSYDGQIITCNKSAEKILGLTADQLCGRTSLDPRWRTIREDGQPFLARTHLPCRL